jgi:antitoxin component YwqK of YwqJK toxin-antitoxin module
MLIFWFPVLSCGQVNQTDSQGRKHGHWEKHTPDGKLRYTGQFQHGIPVDTFRYFSDDGHLEAMLIHGKYPQRVQAMMYFKNGQTKSTGYYFHQQKDSIWHFFRKTGEKVATEHYQHGVLEGKTIRYHLNGQKSRVTLFKNGLKHGPEILYFDNGVISKKQFYVHDTLEGKVQVFDLQGNLQAEGFYKNGKKSGDWIYYDKQGNRVKNASVSD